jgi:sugar phosphate isomerase/epimerase
MIHALSTYMFSGHELTTALLERIREAGIPLVEIFCEPRHFDYRNVSRVSDLAGWFKDSRLKLHSLHGPLTNIADREKIRRLDNVDEVKRALDVAERIPFTYLIQHIGAKHEEYDPRKIDTTFSSLEVINLFAKHRGVEVLLENTPNEMSTAERLRLFLDQTHLPNNFCFDIGHAHMEGSIAGEFDLMQDRIRSTHIHDNDGFSDRHLPPLQGDPGTIDWNKAMTMLRKRDGQYPLMLSLKEQPDIERPETYAAETLKKLEDLREPE